MSSTFDIPLGDSIVLQVHEGSSFFEIGLEAFPGCVRIIDDTNVDGSKVDRFDTNHRLSNDELLVIAIKLIEIAGMYSGRPDFDDYVIECVQDALPA